MVLSVVASPDEDSDSVSEEEGCLLGAVGMWSSRTSGDRRTEHRGMTPGGSSSIHSRPGGGGCGHVGSSAASVKLGGCELVSQGSPVFVSGGLML